jgi:uncharacterized protein
MKLEQVASFKRVWSYFKRKESIIKSIQEQNALSLDLEKKIHQILIYKLEDIYPYKKEKQQKQTLLENMV